MVSIGLAVGVAGALGLMGLMRSLLFEVSPLDPLAFGIAVLAMIVVGLLASLLPASRATRVDPVTALRTEA
jgi:ABC-type antimicrobial peptide transport system permease subunit